MCSATQASEAQTSTCACVFVSSLRPVRATDTDDSRRGRRERLGQVTEPENIGLLEGRCTAENWRLFRLPYL